MLNRSAFSVIAHRGASAYCPENTLAAFQKAKALGVKWIEFDVMLSADGELVVIHDESLERTTNGRGFVADWALSDLQSLSAGAWFAPEYCEEGIPRLMDVLSYIQTAGLSANIEIKAQADQIQRCVDTLYACIQRVPQIPREHLLFSSFDYPSLEAYRQKDAEAPLAYLLHEWENAWQEKADALACKQVHLNVDIASQPRIAAIHASGRPVWVYTVNDPKQAQAVFARGVDGLFSDCPDKILQNLGLT